MFHRVSRLSFATVLLFSLHGPARAQDEAPQERAPAKPPAARKVPKERQAEEDFRQRLLEQARDEYRQYYKEPKTPAEFWAAMNFEINVGRFSLAAEMLRGLVATTRNNDKALLDIEEQEGLSAFLRLRTIPTWVEDPNVAPAVRQRFDRDARANVEALIDHATRVLREHLADPARMARLIRSLSGNEEDRRYAVAQLRRSGALAVPFLMQALQSTRGTPEHGDIRYGLVHLKADATPAILAAFDINDPDLRLELIQLVRDRADRTAVPYLWYLAGQRAQAQVRRQARDALVYFLGTPERNLPEPRAALTREAERYYRHQVSFPADRDVAVWTSNGRDLRPETMSPSRAEEYYGLYFARRALELDPAYEPAQVIFLSIALEKGFERAGIDQPLDKGAPDVKELLKVVSPRLIHAAAERALAERRTPVVLGAVRALGDLGEVEAARSSGPTRKPLLVRALYYPDRRVQLAAADALLRLPGPRPPNDGSRVVEVFRRTLASAPLLTVLVGDADETRGNAVARGIRQAGYQAIIAHTGREILDRLRQAADIDLLIIDHQLPDPELPYLLAQVRTDVNAGLLPVLVTVMPDANGVVPPALEQSLNRLAESYLNVWVVPTLLSPDALKAELGEKILQTQGKPLAEAERKADANLALLWLRRLVVGEVRGYDVRPAGKAILDALHSDELAPLAIEATGRLPDREAQWALANLALDPSRPVELRAAAAAELARHIAAFGSVLTRDYVAGIDNVLRATAPDPKARRLYSNLSLVVGALRPSATETGKRLQRFVPPPERDK